MGHTLYIVWQEDNNIGVPILDEQHRAIISTINSLHYNIVTGSENDIIKPVLVMLVQYTVIHFKAEEALMKSVNYPEFDEHIKLHKKLIEETRRHIANYEQNRDGRRVMKFLKDWWMEHINGEDRKYAPAMSTI